MADMNAKGSFDANDATNHVEDAGRQAASLPGPDALTILRQIADGQMDGFDLLVARYSKRLLDYLSSRIRDFHTAENLSQETFIRIFQAARKGQFNAQNTCFAQWIFTIARNCLTDHHRQCIRKPVALDSDTRKDGNDASVIDEYAWRTGTHSQRQRQRIDSEGGAGLAQACRRPDAIH